MARAGLTRPVSGRPGVPRTFRSEKSLRMHQVACHGVKAASRRYREYTCPLCRSVQKRPRDLAAHIVVSGHHTEHGSLNRIQCGISRVKKDYKISRIR